MFLGKLKSFSFLWQSFERHTRSLLFISNKYAPILNDWQVLQNSFLHVWSAVWLFLFSLSLSWSICWLINQYLSKIIHQSSQKNPLFTSSLGLPVCFSFFLLSMIHKKKTYDSYCWTSTISRKLFEISSRWIQHRLVVCQSNVFLYQMAAFSFFFFSFFFS